LRFSLLSLKSWRNELKMSWNILVRAVDDTPISTMKLQATLAAAMLLLAPALHAFSIGFAAQVPGGIPPNLLVNVPGYGDVSFAAGFNGITMSQSALVIDNTFFGAPALEFVNADTLIVTFLGEIPFNVDFNSVAVSASSSEEFAVVQTGPKEFVVSLQNSVDGAGIAQVVFNAQSIPEPAASLLGLVGLGGFLLRRRR